VSPDRFLSRTLERFEREASRGGVTQLDRLVAGVHVRLRVAGEPLAERLLEGLFSFPVADPGSEPAATFSVYDSASGGDVPPSPPWGEGDYLPRDEVRGFTHGRWRASYSLMHSTLWFYDAESSRGAGWMREPPSPAARERAVPFWPAFNWVLAQNGRPLTHAAAVGEVLLVGPGGTGKSTTCLVAAAAGLPCAGDDYVVLSEEAGGEAWTAHALYRWARLVEESMQRLPALRAVYWDGEKSGVELPGQVESMPVRAVLLPRVAERTGRPRPLPRAVVARALTPSTLIQGAGTDPGVAGMLGRMLRSVPTLGLDVGPDIDRIPDALGEAVEMVAA